MNEPCSRYQHPRCGATRADEWPPAHRDGMFPQMKLNDAYRILDLAREATPAQLKAAYRRLVAEAHPDRGGKAADFIRIRAAYEILSAFLQQGTPEEEVGIPVELRAVIDGIVLDFRENRRWAEAETVRQMKIFESRMSDYIRTASRAELRQFSTVFRTSWNATIGVLFAKCNMRCDEILLGYESWYTKSTQAVFDDMYRRELLHFPLRVRFWEIFAVIAAFAGAATVVVGWTGPVVRWVSTGIMVAALVLSFLSYRWWCRRQRRSRETVEPLSVVPFQVQEGARFQTEKTMRRGRKTTAAMGVAGLFVGNAASSGFALPIVGAVAGMAFGGVFDRLLNPTGRMREGMQADLRSYMSMAQPQVTAYVLEVHETLLGDVRARIVSNYQERVTDTVKLLTTG
jgi:hypothetical protein